MAYRDWFWGCVAIRPLCHACDHALGTSCWLMNLDLEGQERQKSWAKWHLVDVGPIRLCCILLKCWLNKSWQYIQLILFIFLCDQLYWSTMSFLGSSSRNSFSSALVNEVLLLYVFSLFLSVELSEFSIWQQPTCLSSRHCGPSKWTKSIGYWNDRWDS